jgi:hypothetical protein
VAAGSSAPERQSRRRFPRAHQRPLPRPSRTIAATARDASAGRGSPIKRHPGPDCMASAANALSALYRFDYVHPLRFRHLHGPARGRADRPDVPCRSRWNIWGSR